MDQEKNNSRSENEYEIPKFLDKNIRELNQTKSKPIKKYVLVVLGFILMLGVVYALIPKYEVVDVFSFINVKFDGKEGNGVPSFIITDKIDKKEMREGVSLLDFTFTPDSDLSMGENVVLEASHNEISRAYFKKNHFKIEETTKTYLVQTLIALDQLDVFSYLNVQFDGLEGLAKVNLEINDIDGLPENVESLVRTIQFKVDKAEELSSGNMVKIEFELDEAQKSELKKAGYEVLAFERQYEVNALSMIPQTMENIPGLKELKLEALEKAQEKLIKTNKNFKGFKEVYACYTSMASQSNEIKDMESDELVEGASLLMVISHEEKKFFSTKLNHSIFAFSNLSVDQGKVNRSELVEILKPYEQEPLTNIIRVLKQNNFNCFPS